MDLLQQNPLNQPLLSVGNFITPQDLQSHLQELFPEGLSIHGWQYMVRYTDFVNSQGKTYSDYGLNLELILEYVRRASFAEKPSRLQSYFAFGTLDEARAFGSAGQLIYRLDADRAIQVDQGWLRLGNQNVIASFCANKFWSGAGTTNPKWEYILVPPVRIIEQVR